MQLMTYERTATLAGSTFETLKVRKCKKCSQILHTTMPKDPTPHQLSKNLEYVQKEAPFLAKLKAKHQDPVKKKFEDWQPQDDDDDYDEFEGAQVVVLKEGKHYSQNDLQRHLRGEKVDLKKKVNEGSAEEDETESNPVDATGKLMFRAKKKAAGDQAPSVIVGSKALKRKHQETKTAASEGKSDDAGKAAEPKKKKKDKKEKKSMLSFNVEDE